MTSEEEEKVCLFCFEVKKGRRQHYPIEFKKLFACDCIFQSHAECIIRWQITCGDNDLQCPICRVKLIVPEQYGENRILIVYQPPQPYQNFKKIVLYCMVYTGIVFIFFFSMSLRI